MLVWQVWFECLCDRCDEMLRECDAKSFTNCTGTRYLEQTAVGGAVKGPFPPHCLRGSPGAELYPTIQQALSEYAKRPNAALSLVMKGIDVTTGAHPLLIALLFVSSNH